MNDAAARSNSDEIAAPARQLVESLTTEHDEHDEHDEELTATDDEELDIALGGLDASIYSPAAHAAVDMLLEANGRMSVSARQRMVEGAERGLRWRRNMTGSLWRALRAQRQRLALDQAQVAAQLEMSAAALRHLENGSTPVREVDPDLIATWIRAVELDTDVALPALHRSLLPQRTDGVYAGESNTERLSDSAQAYFDAVQQLLG